LSGALNEEAGGLADAVFGEDVAIDVDARLQLIDASMSNHPSVSCGVVERTLIGPGE
jgi:hypothetical protein